MTSRAAPHVRLERWRDADLPLLLAANTPEMNRHLGGPELVEQVETRHRRMLAGWDDGTIRMFRVVALPNEEDAGSVGYWRREWQGQPILEAGWSILTAFQGRGLASAAVIALVEQARSEGQAGGLHAFPAVENAASNAVCRKAGFTLAGPSAFEYPVGHEMICNEWRIELALTDPATDPD